MPAACKSCLGLLFLFSTPLLQAEGLRIETAIQEAIANNLSLAAERYSISVAEAKRITAGLRPNPVLSLSADHLDVLGSGFTLNNGAGPNEYGIRTDYLVERGGKRLRRIDLSTADVSLAEVGVREVMRRVIADLATAFVDVQQAEETLTLARENLDRLNNIVSINETRVKAGDLAVVELNRSQVAAMQYRTAVAQALVGVEQAKFRLEQVLGRKDFPPDFEVAGELRRDAKPVQLDDLQQHALEDRPDFKLAQLSKARSEADLRLQIAQGKVDYTVGAGYIRQQVPAMADTMGVYLSVPLPVFNKNQGEIARAERERTQNEARIRAAEALVLSEVRSAYAQYVAARRLLEDFEGGMLSKAREVRQITEYSYRRGEASLVEFLDAQRAFNETMQSYNEARASYARSLFLLETVSAQSVSGRPVR